MSHTLGPVRLAADPQQGGYLGGMQGLDARVSPQTSSQVDAETRKVIEKAVDTAGELLESHKEALDRLAEMLYEHETVGGEQVLAILKETASANGSQFDQELAPAAT